MTTKIEDNLSTSEGLKNLNIYLADKSFFSGYTPSQADVKIFRLISNPSLTVAYPHCLRWYKLISSYGEEKKNFPKAEMIDTVKNGHAEQEDEEDVDLFGSDDEEEDAEAAKVREERLKAYADKKSKKPGPIAKSQLLLDCKPWDDETDMKKMEEKIRSISMLGLKWGASQLKPLAYGIMKLSILCIVEDNKVSVDDLVEAILDFEDCIQSVDIAAFNKI